MRHSEIRIETQHRIGLVGAGIATSLSPLLHEREAAALGLHDYSYDLIDLDRTGTPVGCTGDVVREAIAAGYTGLNVTHPCKQVVLDVLDELSPGARAIGAVNTVVVAAVDGKRARLIGHNTDGSGFLAALRSQLPQVPLERVLLLGAGGAGSAVAHALAEAGVSELAVADADADRAAQVRSRVHATDVRTVGIDEVPAVLAGCDGVVNATPIGMTGFAGSPVDPAALHPGLWAADVVYRPIRTEFLAAAVALGCPVLDGGHMLVAQAADTFALLTGVQPDRARMRAHLDDLLTAQRLSA